MLSADFLICFPMIYWGFSVKSISSMMATSEDTIFIFTVWSNYVYYGRVIKLASCCYQKTYLSTFWKFHEGESTKITIFNRLFKQSCARFKSYELPWGRCLEIFAKLGGRVGVPPKIGRLTIYGGELTGMWQKIVVIKSSENGKKWTKINQLWFTNSLEASPSFSLLVINLCAPLHWWKLL